MSKPAVNRRYHHNHGFLTAASKSTTRHLAALDFLLNIPMANEDKIKELGMHHAARIRTLDGDNEIADEESIDASLSVINSFNASTPNMLDDYASAPVDSVGRKLQGASAPTMRVPPQFRYNMMRLNEQSAVVRELITRLRNRIVMVTVAHFKIDSTIPFLFASFTGSVNDG
jgi:hypothetical protein